MLSESLLNSIQELSETVQENADRLQLHVGEWNRQLEQAKRWLREHAAPAKEMAQRISRTLGALNQYVAKLPGHTERAAETLALHGWYMSPIDSFADAIEAAELFKTAPDEGHQRMIDFVESRVDEYREYFLKEVSARSAPIEAALEAHETQRYLLSIPVLLAQADGITKERLGIGLYAKNKKTYELRLKEEFADADGHDVLSSALLEPLRIALPLVAHDDNRQEDKLNRHAVMHGQVSDYGERLYSCQSITLLAWVVWLLHQPGVGEGDGD